MILVQVSSKNWNYVKAIHKEVFGVSPFTSMGKIVSGAKDKAEALNQQFILVFTKEDLSSLPDIGNGKIPSMPDIHVKPLLG